MEGIEKVTKKDRDDIDGNRSLVKEYKELIL